MVITKRLNLDNIFLFLFLVLFPFGQIIRIGILQPIDIIAGLGALYTIVKRLKKPKAFEYLENFLLIAAFSWTFGVILFGRLEVLYGFLYLIRLFAYFYFLIYVWNFVKEDRSNQKLLVDSLLVVSIVSAVFGWIQYFNFPALRPFMVWGWDEHLYRLAGTFLDPAFLGIIIVFGLLIIIHRYMIIGGRKYVVLGAFLLISLAFTYSRASYLAFFGGVSIILYFYRKLKYLFFLILGFFLIMIVLPTSSNHVLSFTREFSALARIENYTETLNIFKTSPIFGVGYDNLCLAKAQTIGYLNFSSHACSGSDSGLLFILATTGIAGLIVFVYCIWQIGHGLKHNSYFIILYSSFVALLVHSLFSNSLFYPWIMGVLIILLCASLGTES